MRRRIKTIWGIVIILVIALLAYLYGAYMMYQVVGPNSTLHVTVVPKGTGVIKIAEKLEKEKLISSRYMFLANYYLHGVKQMRAGEYVIPAKATMKQIMELIASGNVLMHKLTVPEGLTSFQIEKLINSNEILGGKPVGSIVEGTCLPETYTFERGYSRDKLVQDMQKDQGKFLKNLENLAQQGSSQDVVQDSNLNKDQKIILASLVEKETSIDGERPQVAGVYVNRLKKGMRLQCDPTVIYGLENYGRNPMGRALSRIDLMTNHPFNTYVHLGLPPAPICHPGKAALKAAYFPQKTDAFYFVADGLGGHRFAATIQEHQKNHANWRKIQLTRP